LKIFSLNHNSLAVRSTLAAIGQAVWSHESLAMAASETTAVGGLGVTLYLCQSLLAIA
jgi:hypothetical protein